MSFVDEDHDDAGTPALPAGVALTAAAMAQERAPRWPGGVGRPIPPALDGDGRAFWFTEAAPA